ncbi:HIG1 domain-containing protein [Hahella sp. SMD15-11]|uniref:HIG1 domain-containing protein n=1 Tax=Thermohahella caldifontis TaxID=3142973 RepID=A0AB39UX83_9GAMM
MSLSLILIIIGVVATGGALFAAWLKTRERMLLQKQKQLRMLLQRYHETEPLLTFLLEKDTSADVARTLNQDLLDMCRQMQRLDPNHSEVLQLLESCMQRESQLATGTWSPKTESIVESDQQLQRIQQVFNQITHKLQRMKLRGKLPAATYESHVAHLRGRLLQIQVDSHRALAERLLAEDNRRDAEMHLKHARSALQKSSHQFDGKTELIKTLSDQIKALQRGELPDQNPKSTEAPQG